MKSIYLSFQEVVESSEPHRSAKGEAVEAVELVAGRLAAGFHAVLAKNHGPGITVIKAVGNGTALVIDSSSKRKRARDGDLVNAGHGAGIRARGPNVG